MNYCTRCVSPSTRPRLTFDENGVCNACIHHDKKQNEIDWEKRQAKLKAICDEFRMIRRKETYCLTSGKHLSSENIPHKHDCIVPCSGGKDGSYVAWKLKHEFGMNPLCVTFAPQMQTWLGRQNLENFKQSGFDHLMITPDSQVYREYAKEWFVKQGMPKQPFVVGISTSILRLAVQMDIRLIVWGEQGEQEYGGDTNYLEKFNYDFLKEIYYEGQDPSGYGPWWQMPKQSDLDKLYSTWWSLFEDWEPEEHAKLAKQKCGFEMLVGGSIGTFTNYSQLDDVMQDLHCYLQFVKFGFGRCTSDASIEIRRGRLSREHGVRVVNRLDGLFPLEYLDTYCDYFEMSEGEFWRTIDSFVNYDVLKAVFNLERPYILRNPCV